MIGKNNYYLKNTKEGTKVEAYSIKKFKVGAASVVIGASIFFGAGAVAQASESVSNNTATDESLGTVNKLEVALKAQAKPVVENTRESVGAAVASKLENSGKETLNKTALTKLIEEIDGKFVNGKYASKTEESVKQLKTALEEARTVLSNAKTQAELSQAHAKLVTATTKLQTKPEEKKQAPAVDTTNGKATVGIKATNTEKASDSNSIANSGSRDERDGKALDANNPFRTGTDAATTDTDSAANQTYTLPGDNASVGELADKLKGLDSSISNETKLASIDEVGRLKNVQPGEIKEINEFGGWSAITADGNKGKFAIARKTDAGVYPIETVNVTRTGAGENRKYVVHVEENAFDRTNEYALFLSKVRTYKTKTEETFDGQPFKDVDTNGGVGEAGEISKGIKGFNGIEKTYKAYSSSTGTGVNISFNTGFTGDIDGKKAGYKVEVIAKFEDGHTQPIYNESFLPTDSTNNGTKHVVPVDANDRVKFEVKSSPEPTVDALNQQLATYKNRQVNRTGSFTSKNIELPKGAVEYTVRISASDNSRLGMGYQTTWAQYALPVSGLGFTITQDTNRVARALLERVYNKLLDTRDADKRGKTPESQKAYQDQLDAIKALLDGTLQPTDAYKKILTTTLEAQKALKVDKSALKASKGELDNLVSDDPTPGKTPETVTKYNEAKTAAEEEAKKAKAIIDSDKATVDEVAQAVANVKAKRAELQTARALLVVAATEEQKTKLKNDSDALKPADTNGKTPKSIEAYNAQYKQLEGALNKAKAQAKTVLDKEANAGKVEATDAQIEVDKIKDELDKAAALLKDKGDTAGLETAKNELKTATEATNVTDGKTKDSADKYNEAKKAAEAVVKEVEAVIADVNSTTEDVANALVKVNAAKEALADAKSKLVEAATQAEKEKLAKDAVALTKADTSGKTPASIAEYEKKYEEFKAELEAAQKAAQAVAEKGENASALDALKAQEKVTAVKDKLAEAAKLLKDKANKEALTNAKTTLETLKNEETPTGKTADSLAAYTAAKTAAEEEIAAAQKILADDNVTQAQVDAALAKINEKKEALETAKDKLVDAASQEQKDDLAKAEEKLKLSDTTGKTAESIKAYNEAVEKLKADIEAAKKAAKDLLAKGDNAGELEAFRVQAKINGLKEKLAEAAKLLESVDKAAAKAEIEAAKAAKEKAIEANPNLTPEQKTEAKAKVAEEATKAIAEIEKATTAEAVTKAKEEGKVAIEKAAAKAEIEAAKAAKEKAIEANPDLTPEQKTEAKAKVAEEATKAIAEIDKATTAETVIKAKEEGKVAIEKAAAKAEIEAAKAAKEKAIDENPNLTPEQKTEAKAKVAEEAAKAIAEIDKATTAEAVTKAKEEGKVAIEKAVAKAEIEAAKAAKEKAIEANPDLTPEQKETAKAKVGEEAKKANEAIDKAATAEAVTKAKEEGKVAIEKAAAKAEIEAAKAAKEKAIDARTDLLQEEKVAAKKVVREEADAANSAIDNATTIQDINKVLKDGKDNIAKVNLVGAKAEAKSSIEERLADKEKEIEERTDLTREEKNKAKALARGEAEEAKKLVEKATNLEEIEKALRPFLYQIDQDALVFDLPTLDIQEALKSLVQGILSVEQGNQISDQDILSKLDLPEGLEVVKIEKPTTTILGDTSAKVTIKLSNGSYATVEVPVEVVKELIDNSKVSEDNRRPEDKVRVDKTTENTNRENDHSSVSKKDSKTSTNTLPNTGVTETNTGLAGLGVAILGGLLAVARRRKEK